MKLYQVLNELGNHLKDLGLDNTPTLVVYDEDGVVGRAMLLELGTDHYSELTMQPGWTYGGIKIVNSAD